MSRANDPLETEADRIANAVTHTHGRQAATFAGTTVLRRKCAECAEDEQAPLQTKRAHAGQTSEFAAPELVHEVLRSPGEPLDPSTRGFMEARLGADFAHVRVHADAKAAASARTIGAQAFTAGSHVVFGSGRFAPTSQGGRQLLAHELVHVMQQSQAPARGDSVHRQVDEDAAPGSAANAEPAEPAQAGEPATGGTDAPGCGNLQWLPQIAVAADYGFAAVEGTSIASDGTLYMPTSNNLRIGQPIDSDHEFVVDLPTGLFRGAAQRRLTRGFTVTSARSDAMRCGVIVATQVDNGRPYRLRVCLCPVGEF